MTDDDDDGELDFEPVTPARWSWVWALGFAVNSVGNAGRFLSAAADELSTRIARHDVWRVGQREFEDQVRLDLERLPDASVTDQV